MKKILITGASKGIGKSIALKLIDNNYIVIGLSRTHVIKHKNYFPAILDLSKPDNFKEEINKILVKHKKIDAVISNAGNGIFDNLENISEKDIEKYFHLNLISHILISKYFVTHFKGNKQGQFIFMGSEAAEEATQKSTLYASAKHGLLGFSKAFRAECNKSDIRVTIINPGMVRTSFFKNLKFKPGKSKKNAISKKDIAELIIFLLNSSPFINYSDIKLSPIKKVIDFDPY